MGQKEDEEHKYGRKAKDRSAKHEYDKSAGGKDSEKTEQYPYPYSGSGRTRGSGSSVL